jgi:hypothetical protein
MSAECLDPKDPAPCAGPALSSASSPENPPPNVPPDTPSKLDTPPKPNAPGTPDMSDRPASDRPLRELSQEIVRNVTVTLHSASVQLAEILEREKSPERAKCQTYLNLIGKMPSILTLAAKTPDRLPPPPGMIPPCPFCKAPAGQHMAHECPTVAAQVWKKNVFDYRTGTMITYRKFYEIPDDESGDWAVAKVPRCGVCGKGPGAHWPDECPDNPIRDKMIGDRVVPPSAQKANSPAWKE